MNLYAFWDLSLNTDCPHCDEYVDLLKHDTFWEDHQRLQPCEDRRDVDVVCPNCNGKFKVDLAY